MTARNALGELQGLAPMATGRIRYAGIPLRRMGFLGDAFVGSDFLDIIRRDDSNEDTSRQFAEYLRQMCGDWDLLELNDIEEGSPTITAVLNAFAGNSFVVEQKTRFECPFELLQENLDFDGFLRTTRRAENFRRRSRAWERESGARLDVMTRPEEVEDAMEHFFKVHVQRRADVGDTTVLQDGRIQSFHTEAASRMAEEGKAVILMLSKASAPVAAVYGLVHQNTFSYFNAGFDPQWTARSPGLVMVGESFRHAFDRGCTRFDFLRGSEPYKFDWVTKRARTVSIRVWQRGSKIDWALRAQGAVTNIARRGSRYIPASVKKHIRRIQSAWTKHQGPT